MWYVDDDPCVLYLRHSYSKQCAYLTFDATPVFIFLVCMGTKVCVYTVMVLYSISYAGSKGCVLVILLLLLLLRAVGLICMYIILHSENIHYLIVIVLHQSRIK